jgi:hypothetical protein
MNDTQPRFTGVVHYHGVPVEELLAAARAVIAERDEFGEYNSLYNLDEQFNRLRAALLGYRP